MSDIDEIISNFDDELMDDLEIYDDDDYEAIPDVETKVINKNKKKDS
jgi:hypothetical protein